jgi:hypothetical protein
MVIVTWNWEELASIRPLSDQIKSKESYAPCGYILSDIIQDYLQFIADAVFPRGVIGRTDFGEASPLRIYLL